MSLDLVVTEEERIERERDTASLVQYASRLVIDSVAAYVEAAGWLREVVIPLKRKIAETFRPRIQQANQLHRGLVADERRFLDPIEQIERAVKGRMEAWDRAEQARRRAEQAQAGAAAREEAQAAAFVAAEQRGDEAAMSAIATAPPSSVPLFTPPPPPAPTVGGVSYRTAWSAEVVDMMALVQAVGQGHVPLTMLEPNMAVLNQMARALKEALAIPGVRAVSRRDVAVRTGGPRA